MASVLDFTGLRARRENQDTKQRLLVNQERQQALQNQRTEQAGQQAGLQQEFENWLAIQGLNLKQQQASRSSQGQLKPLGDGVHLFDPATRQVFKATDLIRGQGGVVGQGQDVPPVTQPSQAGGTSILERILGGSARPRVDAPQDVTDPLQAGLRAATPSINQTAARLGTTPGIAPDSAALPSANAQGIGDKIAQFVLGPSARTRQQAQVQDQVVQTDTGVRTPLSRTESPPYPILAGYWSGLLDTEKAEIRDLLTDENGQPNDTNLQAIVKELSNRRFKRRSR